MQDRGYVQDRGYGFSTGFVEASAPASYAGALPPVPTPAARAPGALPAGAPALGLNLETVTIIVSGDVNITTTFARATIQRR